MTALRLQKVWSLQILRNRLEGVAAYAPAPPDNGMHATRDTLLLM